MMISIMALSYCQESSLPIKTKYNGQNAVIISEAQMHSLNRKILEFEAKVFEFSELKIEFIIIQNELKKLKLENEKFISQIKLKEKEIEASEKIHEAELKIKDTEIVYYKSKRKQKFTAYLLGFLGGAVTILLIN